VPSDTGSPGPSFISYIVLKTDVAGLSGIAAKFNVALPILEAANPQIANFNVIWAGMVVYIPPPGWQPSPSASPPVASPSAT